MLTFGSTTLVTQVESKPKVEKLIQERKTSKLIQSNQNKLIKLENRQRQSSRSQCSVQPLFLEIAPEKIVKIAIQ